MNLARTFAVASLLGLTSFANASSLAVTTDTLVNALAATIEGVSDATSSVVDNKVVIAAKDDAAGFVASEGAVRGAQLEAALRHIRERQPNLHADDLQLAQAILAY